MSDPCVAQLVRADHQQSNDPGSNPGTDERVFFSTKRFLIISNLIWTSAKYLPPINISNVPPIFDLKPLFLEKDEIKWNQTDRQWGVFFQFKSPPIKWNKATCTRWGVFSMEKIPTEWNQKCGYAMGSFY